MWLNSLLHPIPYPIYSICYIANHGHGHNYLQRLDLMDPWERVSNSDRDIHRGLWYEFCSQSSGRIFLPSSPSLFLHTSFSPTLRCTGYLLYHPEYRRPYRLLSKSNPILAGTFANLQNMLLGFEIKCSRILVQNLLICNMTDIGSQFCLE